MLANFFQWFYDLSVSATVRESLWVFPTLECVHIYSMIFLISVLGIFDLRLLGISIGRQRQPLSQLCSMVLRSAWVCFIVNAVTGLLLFVSLATDYYINSAFQIKVLLIFLGLVFHSVVLPRAARNWEDAPSPAFWSRFAGGFSLVLWIGVVVASRWIAFV